MALGLILVAVATLAAVLRTIWNWQAVFTGDSVRFPSTDPWAHVRQVEYLVRNFPDRLSFDPFAAYPDGQVAAVAPLLDYLAAVAAKLLGPVIPHSSPTLVVCAFIPPVLAGITVLAVFWVGRCFFNRAVGLFAAFLFAVTPGVHFSSSVLGFLDHHVLESLLSTLTFGVLLLAYRRAAPLPSSTISPDKRARLTRACGYSSLFGAVLTCYLTTWIGGSFLVLIVATWIICQSVIDHQSATRFPPVTMAVMPGLVLAWLVLFPMRHAYPLAEHQLLTLGGALLLAVGLAVTSFTMNRLGCRRYFFVLFTAALAVGGSIILYSLNPFLFSRVLSGIGPSGVASAEKTIGEVRSLFWSEQGTTLAPAWRLFATGYPLALVGLVMICIRAVRRRGQGEDTLLLVWSGAVLLALIGQIRFGYYAAINVSILASFACYEAVKHSGLVPDWLHGAPCVPLEGHERERPERRNEAARARRPHATPPLWQGALLVTWLVLLAVVPPVSALWRVAGTFSGPSDAWMEALQWMRDQTPEPFGHGGFFYADWSGPAETVAFEYPESAYGVMCWWDYGYWVTGIARRIPNANPTQYGARESARFYLASDESSALDVLRKMGSRYVIVDGALPMLVDGASGAPTGKFGAMARWADRPEETYYEVYYSSNAAGKLEPFVYFYPDYYRTMCARLFLYGGAAFEPSGPFQVVRFHEIVLTGGQKGKRIEELHTFDSHEEVVRFLSLPANQDARLVSSDPTRSCVPLEAVDFAKHAYDAPASHMPFEPTQDSVRVFRVQTE